MILSTLVGGLLGSSANATPVLPDPAANVVVGTVTQGAGHSWQIPVSWDPSANATGYTVTVTNLAGNATYATQDVPTTSTTLTTSGLLDGTDYKASVVPFNTDGTGTGDTAQFTAPPLDRTAPTGTFSVAPTKAWLMPDFTSFTTDAESLTASVTITQTALSDDTSGTTITRRVLAGDGSAAQTWASGTTFKVTYRGPGTFTPQVELTDGFGNTGTISLAPVTIGSDVTNPVVQIARPSASMRPRIAGWTRIKGTATDTGTGVQAVAVFVLEKRGGVWYAYSFGNHKWVKGRTGEMATLQHTHAMPGFTTPDSLGQWRTGKVRGLTTGKISVRAIALDGAFNIGRAPVVRQLLTRS